MLGSQPNAWPAICDTLLSWTLENFNTYWQPLLRRASSIPDPWSLTAVTSYGAVWMVLGPCRLHYTLATGQIASKEKAGCYAIQVFPERWHRAVNEAQRVLQRTPLVLLTGGAAVQIESLSQCSYVSVPDLVLRGVALRSGLPLK